MAKKLFFLEFRRALPSFLLFNLAIVVGMEGLELIYNRFEKNPSITHGAVTLHGVVNAVLLSIIVIVGFPSGARAFSGNFKETNYVFLQSLPLPRDRAWVALVLANLAASLVSLLVVPVLRPSVFTVLPGGTETAVTVAAGVFAGYFLFFSAGCCFSMLFSKTVLNYVLGFGLVLATLAALLALVLYSTSSPLDLGQMSLWDESEIPLTIAAYSFLVLIFLVLSLRFFTRGEFNLLKVQIRNSISVVAPLLLLVIILSFFVNLGWFATFDNWALDQWEVSQSGKYLLVLERREAHPQFSRLSIVQVSNGALVASLRGRGFASAHWSSADDSVVLVAREDSPLFRLGYLLPESDQIIRLSSEGKELSHRPFRFTKIITSGTMPAGKRLLVLQKGDVGTIGLFDDRSAGLIELTHDYLGDFPLAQVSVGEVPGGSLVLFQNFMVPSSTSIWMVGLEAKRLPWAPPDAAVDWPLCVLYGTAYHASAQCLQKLTSLFPSPGESKINSKANGPGKYLFGGANEFYGSYSNIEYLDAGTTVTYVQSDHAQRYGKLFIVDQQKKNWRLLAENIPVSDFEFLNQSGFTNRISSVIMDSSRHLVAYVKEMGDTLYAYLYDDNLHRTMEIGSFPRSSTANSANLQMPQVTGLNGVAVMFGMSDAKPHEGIVADYFPQSGQLVKFVVSNPHSGSNRELLYMDQAGNQIFSQYWYSWTINYRGADEKERQLWPLAQ